MPKMTPKDEIKAEAAFDEWVAEKGRLKAEAAAKHEAEMQARRAAEAAAHQVRVTERQARAARREPRVDNTPFTSDADAAAQHVIHSPGKSTNVSHLPPEERARLRAERAARRSK